MKTIYLLKGLPASGKSTWARKTAKDPSFKRINKDDLRSMLDCSYWSRDNEKMILEARDVLVRMALAKGKHVIVDDTNFHPKHEAKMKEIAKSYNAKVEVKSFDLDVEECITRDLKRSNSVGEKVIRDMYLRYILKPNLATQDETLEKAIICDIDGTLANKSDRSPYDWHRVKEDTIKQPVLNILNAIKETHTIILLTGRDGICRGLTEEWLAENDVPYNALFIRDKGNTEKDSIIKERIFRSKIKDKYYIDFVLDDRQQVVDMWRSIGLTCLQVDYGNF